MHSINAPGASNERFWEKSLSLYSNRLEILASNIANADTPHYKARDLDFRSALSQALAGPEGVQAQDETGRSNHPQDLPILYRIPTQYSVDGNTVDMDVERAAFAETAVRYEFAVKKVADEYREMSDLLKSLPY